MIRFLWHGVLAVASLDADRTWVFGDDRLAAHLDEHYGPAQHATAAEQLAAAADRLAGVVLVEGGG